MMTATKNLGDFKVLVFDCYATLIDWENGMLSNLGSLRDDQTVDETTFLERIRYHQTRIQLECPKIRYPQCLQEAYVAAASDLHLKYDSNDARAFGQSIPKWEPFPDSRAALKVLSNLGLRLCVLSNVDKASFKGTRRVLEDGWSFDGVYVAEEIGSYKPSPANYQYTIDAIKTSFGMEKDDILVVAKSKPHDIDLAHTFGIKGAHIDRPEKVRTESGDPEIVPDWTFEDMARFAEAMRVAKQPAGQP